MPIKEGDEVQRIFGDGFLTSVMRVSAVDERFIYCDAQKRAGEEWMELPPDSAPWKFDVAYGVETDEEMGWSVSGGVVLSYLDHPEIPYRMVVSGDRCFFALRNAPTG